MPWLGIIGDMTEAQKHTRAAGDGSADREERQHRLVDPPKDHTPIDVGDFRVTKLPEIPHD